jgi:hypothetical protein
MQNELRTLPDRVLKIGHEPAALVGRDGGFDAGVKLYESRGEKATYAALSHRWGDEQPLRLLLENHADFQRGIAWSALPKTFQHAILFARKMGIHFIWIDSLAIIQDSKEDWLEQSGKMAAIYENATITLAATTSEGGRSGMFVEPTELQKGYVTDGAVKVAVDGNDEGARRLLESAGGDRVIAFVKQKMEWGDHPFPGHFASPDLPLLKRGWVYQERLLSPRIAHFGSLDLIWECNGVITCYCDTWMHSGSRNPISHPVKPMHAACLTASPGNESRMAYRWIRIVEAYTMLELTFMSDRLIAIAGIAKQFSRGLHNKKYCAGLWEESLLTGLTWARKDPHRLLVRPSPPSTGPSWSWISVPSAIVYLRSQYPGYKPNDGASVKQTSFTCNDEEFTTLRGGSITLHGKVRKGETRVKRVTDWQGKEEMRHYCYFSNDSKGHDAFLDYGSYDEAVRDEVYCLFMGFPMDDGGHTLLMLILSQVDEREQVYSRVGLGTFLTKDKLFDRVEREQDVTII